jgi:poly-gamma-glutamate capsule biosynthesis protein CapA/YwtB (metallophosphatase superfamily)
MLGRKVGEALTAAPVGRLVAPDVVAAARDADLFVLNLECCISERGSPWPNPRKPFFFRAPPRATELLRLLGVGCVTLANNHALDYGTEALADTVAFLDEAGIAHVGAGMDLQAARAPKLLSVGGLTVGVVGFSDHPLDFAAADNRPGVAYADLQDGLPEWVVRGVSALTGEADVVLVTPHWGPNMTAAPVPAVRAAAGALRDAGATLVAGHSAHVFHGVDGPILYDLGDFLDDYAVDSWLRNDLGLLWFVELDPGGLRRLEAVALALDYCHTRLAAGAEADWIRRRFRRACAAFGTEVSEEGGRLVVDWR